MFDKLASVIKSYLSPTPIPKYDEYDLIKSRSMTPSAWNTLSDITGNSWYDVGIVNIANMQYGDVNNTEAERKAISSISNLWNALGVYRKDFDKELCDTLAQNAYYSMCEKAIVDYISLMTWTVTDEDGNDVEEAIEFLNEPNYQDDFVSLVSTMLPNLVRYDAGVWVKSYDKAGYLKELKTYLGTEFWKMLDKPTVPRPTADGAYNNIYISHGYTRMYWQRSRVGVYISFLPEEIVYFMLYPQADGIYGKAHLLDLKYHIQYLIDSTRAAGKTFANGTVPSMVWNHPEIQTRDELVERIEQVDVANKGSYKFGNILHTVSDESVSTLSHKLIDMQWLEGQELFGKMVWAMFGFPASEFIQSDVSRATAYVERNISKSKAIYPIIARIENKINKEVLPYLKGYEKGWKFKYLKNLDIDDQNRIAQIQAIKVNSYANLLKSGMSPKVAIKLTNLADDLTTDEIDSIDKFIASNDIEGEIIEPNEGRYTDPSYNNTQRSEEVEGKLRSDNNEDQDLDERYESGNTSGSRKIYVKSEADIPEDKVMYIGSKGGKFFYSD